MAQMMTEKKRARFDVRKWNEKLPREQWPLAGNDENISVTITYPLSELPDQYKPGGKLDEFVRTYQSREAKEAQQADDRAAIKFKVGAGCKWFDKYGHETTRPDNEYLDGKEFDVQISYSRKDRNPQKATAPCGYWANGIMFREVTNDMFAGCAFETDEAPADEEQQQAAQAQPAQPAAAADDSEEVTDLPF